MFYHAYLQLGFYSLCGISIHAYSVHCCRLFEQYNDRFDEGHGDFSAIKIIIR